MARKIKKEALLQRGRVDFLASVLKENNREIRELTDALKKKKLQTQFIQKQFDEEKELLDGYVVEHIKKSKQNGATK